MNVFEFGIQCLFGQHSQPVYYWTESIFHPKMIEDRTFTDLASACYFRYGKEYKGESTMGWELIKVHAVTTVRMEEESKFSIKGEYDFRWWEGAKKMIKDHKKKGTYPVDFFK